jgi:farnesyl-diphosphate farnesyltransferase
MSLSDDARRVLQETSRTFFLPIQQLPAKLQESIGSAYLCMRAIDELEDHQRLERADKIALLSLTSQLLQTCTAAENVRPDIFQDCFAPHQACLPEVTLRLADWICLAQPDIAPRIWEATATMADRMANWVRQSWQMQSEDDLNRYTYDVAGATGILLCDLWAWAGGEQMHRSAAIQFGRALQAVNILRNRQEDLERGVNFFPDGWTQEQMHEYARKHLEQAEIYARTLPSAPFEALIHIPLELAIATLHALEQDASKLSRHEVLTIVGQILAEEKAQSQIG